MNKNGPVTEWLHKNATTLLTRENIILGRVRIFKAPEEANLGCVECAATLDECKGKSKKDGFQKCFRADLDTDDST
ncbi:MAG: hypothetical protein WAV41_03185 [Microgenomates group bacterium]